MNDQTRHILFVQADKVPAIDEQLHFLSPWIYHSDRRYFDVLLRDYNPAEALARWLGDDNGEMALSCARLMIADDQIAGGFLAMPGREFRPRREANILDLVRHGPVQRRHELRARVQDLYPLFGPLDGRDFYVSKFGLLPAIRDRSLADALMEECIEQGRSHSFDRLRIDVDATHDLLCHVCSDHGFEVIDRGIAPVSKIIYLNLALPL